MTSVTIPIQYPVVSDPQILGGVPVIKGTRIPAALVFDLMRRGYSTELIRKEYPSLSSKKLNDFMSLMTHSFDAASSKTL